MPERLVRRREVEALTGLCRSSLYSKIAENIFPKPVKIGPQAVAWLESDVQRWISERIAESRAEEAGNER